MLPPIDNAGTKIKGGRWTVVRFFLISTAYTSVWLAVSSQLDYFKELYGPQILLQLNIAYYLPTIPLLLVSSLLDRHLDKKLGIARTILMRLSVGLLGYGVLCTWFPFQSQDIRVLLTSVVGLGLFSGLAFSASYQLVSRFANKNVIALGLGCSATGPLILALELAFGIGPHATRGDRILLYGSVTLLVAVGAAASASLIARHWDALGGVGGEVPADDPGTPPHGGRPPTLETPLLDGDLSAARSGSWVYTAPASPLPPLVSYSSLEPYRTFLSTDAEVVDRDGSFHGALSWLREEAGPREAKAEVGLSRLDSGGGSSYDPHGDVPPPRPSVTLPVLRAIWSPLAALFISSTIALAVFPFFTYVPSSGLLGSSFPRILFFARVFADIVGRVSPRARFAAPASPNTVLAVTLIKLSVVPLFFIYLKAPPAWRSDLGAMGFICTLWLLGGWINTNANLFAPRLVPVELKGTAAAFMAIAYQTAHFTGLAIAIVVSFFMYGDTAPSHH